MGFSQKEYQRKYRALHRKTLNARRLERQRNNPELHREACKRYRLKNKEKEKRAAAMRWQKNKAARIAKSLEWKNNNIVRFKQLKRIAVTNRNARKKNAQGKYTITDVRAMYDSQSGKCTNCKCDLLNGYHVDHMVPLSRGGSNWPHNLQLLCPPCNLSKGALTMEEFTARKVIAL